MLAGGGSTSIDDLIAATRVGGGIINKARTAPRSAARSKPEVHLRSKLTKYQQCSPEVHTRSKFKKESRRRTTTQVIWPSAADKNNSSSSSSIDPITATMVGVGLIKSN